MVLSAREWGAARPWVITAGVAVCGSEALYLTFHRFQDVDLRLDLIVAASLLLSVLYLFLVYLLLQFSQRSCEPSFTFSSALLLAALVFRITVLPLNPSFSDDLYRYRWEGQLQLAGGNPYQIAPDHPDWLHLRDRTYERIPVRDYPGGYGPIVMLVEHATAALATRIADDPFAQARIFRWPAALADIAIVLLLAGWLRCRGKPIFLAAIYALCPLPVIEFWWMGHNDALAVAFLIGAFWAMDARRDWIAFLLLGAAVATKWWPALLFPAFLGLSRETPRRLLPAIAGLAVVPLAFLPYWSDISLNMKFMGGFAGGWRNNDSLFGITYALAGQDFDTAKHWTLSLIAALSLFSAIFVRPREKSALVVIVGTLLLSANCHPWYLTWFLPLLAFYPWPPLLLWIALSPLFYEVLAEYAVLGEWTGSRPSRWLVYVPVFLMMAFRAVRAFSARGAKPTAMEG